MQSLFILGRQPVLGLAELESLYGSNKIDSVGTQAAVLKVDPCLIAYERLGGSLKFGKVLTSLQTTVWHEIESFLISASADHSKFLPPGKMYLGLSLYDFDVSSKTIMSTALKLKRAIQETGRSVRIIPNKEPALTSAQIIHNKLLSPNGWELLVIRNQDQTLIAQTIKVQDLASYTKRDRQRPKRDTKVGMLPPKLAQIIINLAVGLLPAEKLESICEIPAGQKLPKPDLGQTVLDPFCGTGVIVQESLLMGYKAYGTDINPKMVSYTKENLEWIKHQYRLSIDYLVEQADATNYKWPQKFDYLVSELFLGPLFQSVPSQESLNQVIKDCDDIVRKFLINLATQLKPGQQICLAVPAWQVQPNSFKHLPFLDQLTDLGYNKVSFKSINSNDLIYYRPRQIVARKLIVIRKK